jgi:hypothetical protein
VFWQLSNFPLRPALPLPFRSSSWSLLRNKNHHKSHSFGFFHLVSPPSPWGFESRSFSSIDGGIYWATAGTSRGVRAWARESCRGQRSDARAAVCQLETASFAAKHDRAPSPCCRRRRPRASRPLLSPSRLRHRLGTSRSSPRRRHAVEKGPSAGHDDARPSCQEENGPPLPSGGCCYSWCYGPRLHLTLGLNAMSSFQFRVDFDQ